MSGWYLFAVFIITTVAQPGAVGNGEAGARWYAWVAWMLALLAILTAGLVSSVGWPPC